jgi:D-alanyl-D-alanine carboxypeptidase
MKSVINTDQSSLAGSDSVGYFRYAAGPPHPETKEGNGWLSAAGELSMTVEDLLKWDISVINQSVLKPESYQQMESEVRLKNGVGTRYALGLDVYNLSGHWMLEHSGEVSGFTAANMVFPDDRTAIAVLTNQMAADASGTIGQQIFNLLLASNTANNDSATAQARRILEGLQKGTLDRSLFTEDANQFFSERALNDYRSSLGPLGPPQSFRPGGKSLRGGMTFRSYTAQFPQSTFTITTFEQPDGKLEQYLVIPE